MYPLNCLFGTAGLRSNLRCPALVPFISCCREQTPKEHGTSDVSVLVNVTLPSSTLDALVLEKQEYAAAQIFTLRDILTERLATSDAEALSPSLVKLYSDYGGFRFHPAGTVPFHDFSSRTVMLLPCSASSML
jgi:hypothetical protein